MEQLKKNGYVIFKKTGVKTPLEYEKFLEDKGIILSDEYRPGIAPRIIKGKKSFSSTEAPKCLPIPPHNEMAYSRYRPRILSFWCKTAPKKYGETPLFDCAKIYRDLINNDIVMESRIFKRFYPNKKTEWDKGDLGGATWMGAFGMKNRKMISKFCSDIGMNYQWSHEGLITKIKIDPVLNDGYGNKCLQLQTPLLDIYDYMKMKFPERFDNEEYDKIIKNRKHVPKIEYSLNNKLIDKKSYMDCIFKHSIWPKWSEGDIWIIDNIRMAHARMNVIDEREIIACIGNFHFVELKSRL